MRIRKSLLLISLSFVFCAITEPIFAQTTRYIYDDLNRVIKAEYGDGTVIAYAYDEVGNRTLKTVVKLLDADEDGISNDLENTLGTNPFDADTDDDGLLDGQEDANHNGVVDSGETDPCNIDTDGDGIQDGTEFGYTLANIGRDTDTEMFQPDMDPSTTTNADNADTDGDGLNDGQEDINHDGKIDDSETCPNTVNPVIVSLELPWGKPGGQIKITGFNFGDDKQDIKQVTFYNQLPQSQIISWIDTEIICTVPNNTQSGRLTVTNNLGISNFMFFSLALFVPSDYAAIQAAIDAAATGDTVIVVDGTYIGAGNKNLDFNGKTITVQSQNGPNNCSIDCENDGRGFIFHNGEKETSRLCGFTIANGNRAGYSGGAIYCYDASPTITNCAIKNNSAGWGGGICCYTASPVIINCTIVGNTAGSGGGVYCYNGSAPVISNCTITQNTATSGGGGIKYNESSPIMDNCTISENSATEYGGGIYEYSSASTIINCAITENNVKYGGGIYSYLSSSTITNCLIIKNNADYGGGIFSYTSPSGVTNCTFSRNTANISAGAVYVYKSSPTFINSILWDDIPQEIVEDATSVLTITYSDIQGGYAGNLNVDPAFISPVAGNYHLLFGSSCIDTGSNLAAPQYDKDGILRPQDGNNDFTAICDIGAYEYDINDPPVTIDDNYTVEEGGTINNVFAPGILRNDTDAENNPLTAILVTNVSHGNLTLNANGSFIYVHDGSENTIDSFIYKSNDGINDGNTAAVNITIIAVNDNPVSVNDNYIIEEGGTINNVFAPGILCNDTDAENDPLIAILVTNVSHGILTLNANGSFVYLHDGSETANDSFSYKVNDGIADGNIAVVNITIQAVNDAPAGVNDNYIVNENGTINVSAPGVLANDKDGENEPLTAVLVSSVAHGSLILNPDGSFSYVNDGSENTIDSFVYKSNDGIFDSNLAVVTITVTPVNDAPVVEDIPNRSFTEGGVDTSIDLDDYVNDVDNPDNEINWTYTGNSRIDILIDEQTNIVTFSSSLGWTGEETITFTAMDTQGLFDRDDVKITVVLEEVSVNIHKNFNALSFCVATGLPPVYKASQLVQDMAIQNLNVDVVMQWDGSWIIYLPNLAFTDFDMNLKAGFFIHVVSPDAYNAGTWVIRGSKISLPRIVEFNVGWNLISLPTTISVGTASELMEQMVSQGCDVDVIMLWDGADWVAYCQGLPFNNFEIEKGKGYFVRCKNSVDWEMK